MAVKLAKKIFNLKCKGSTLVMRWRKNKQDIEVITGHTPRSDRRIQIPEYEEEVGEKEDIETELKPEPNLLGKSLPRT